MQWTDRTLAKPIADVVRDTASGHATTPEGAHPSPPSIDLLEQLGGTPHGGCRFRVGAGSDQTGRQVDA